MTVPDARRDAIEAAAKLTEAVDGLGEQLRTVSKASEERDAGLRRYGHRNRWLIIGAIISLLIDLPLTGLYIAGNVRLNHTTEQLRRTTAELAHTRATAAELHAVLVTGCEANNDLKAKQGAIWTFIEGFLGPKPGQTEAQKAASRAFLGHLESRVSAAYQTRDCAQIYKLR